jgi:hypothetical protein
MKKGKRRSDFYQQYHVVYDENSNQWKLKWDKETIMSGTKEYLQHYMNLLVCNGNIIF